MPIVTLTTDFGLFDNYVALLKGALLRQSPNLQIVDISHNVRPYDIVQGAFVLKNTYPSFPVGTIHIITVNNSPEGMSLICLQHEGQIFIGPDNGIFSLVFSKMPNAFRLDYDKQSPFPIQQTLANTVQHLAAGQPLHEVGFPAGETVQRIALQPVLSHSQIRGSVIYVDHYENVVINIPKDLFEKVQNGRKFALFFKRNDPITHLSRHYTDVPVGDTLCLFNAAGFLEIAVSMGKASSLLGLKLDDMVQVDFT
ncbi:MAG: SAM-dependent chlorinase/fluorinase [Saprospiraceae bacterium]|nr:SAM-dependent chlorinase/fluorinase [Saprospiraceae bacterium]MCF8251003.1 SAM-dependent chlorinase/fluorinase [Saprospiraceae bacterium]MCF8282814.1 SAM-dependent chlorinase/fluorinase [Bacteroidales bacterium]MCF8311600.1 SAM-dependent chlorinase/fluorinase [Saprospiraceae bacterium]MCF8440941.1 SAM-dependent chlorinase/fluorinase [Saprospiraceae bacterium]